MFRALIRVSIFVLPLLIAPPARAAWINDTAPDFTLQDMTGNSVSLPALKGKVVLIDFWATWCQPCKKEFPALNRLADNYKDADIVILAINLDKKKENAAEFLQRLGLTLSKNMVVLLDPQSAVVSSYAARAMPTSYIVDKAGMIRYVHLGFNEADPARWVAEIEPLLK
jgi:thiol-disulfide isomerase/thioredoxin